MGSVVVYSQDTSVVLAKDTVIDSIHYRHIDRYSDGTISAIGNYDEEGYTKIGKWWYFTPDGNLKMSGEYRNGRKNGPWLIAPYTLEYYRNGQLHDKKQINPGSTY